MAAYPSLSRRSFLRASVGAFGLSLLAACAPQPPSTNPETKPTDAPQPATVSKPTAAPTTAAAIKPTEGVQAAPAAKTTAQSGAATPPKLGQQLIGKIEGATVVVDPAQFPSSFKEAPMLAEFVRAGTLPPVEQRVPRDPLVLKPLHEIGKYGGTWRRAFTGPGDHANGVRTTQEDKILYFDYTGNQVVPNIARGWEVSPDGKMTTVLLRRGMKWSDGHPFTADDFMFWYEDVYQNKELVGSPLAVLFAGGKPVRMEKLDESTIRFVSESAYFALPSVLAGVFGLGQHTRYGRDGYGAFAPAHYLKQVHPKYTPQAEIDVKVKEAGFDNWVSLFKFTNDASRNVDLPVVSAWKITSPITTPTWAFERNPYSIWVDTEGNQLPYIDKVVMTLGENLEVINLRAIAGEYDSQERHIDLGKLPVFLENREKGDYTVRLDPAAHGSDAGLFVNQSFDKDPEIAKWLSHREFRIALSHGIDREQINESFALGLGVVGSAAPDESTLYSPGPEYRTLHSTLDVAKANELLDKIGLQTKDAEGYRLRTDGQGRLRLEVITYIGFLQSTQMAEMIRDQWRQIGIQADVAELERSLAVRRRAANETQLYMDTQWGADSMFAYYPEFFPFRQDTPVGSLYGAWFASNGERGKEPPPRMREVMDLYRKATSVPDQERVELGKEIWKIVLDEVWIINVIANSPASQGVRIVKNSMGNIPERVWNSAAADNPAISRAETWYFKN